jgi:transposase-like protein
LRFTLSYRDVEDLLAERGLEVSNETIRRWMLKFGPAIARNLRRGRATPHDKWHLDEMVVSVAGRRMYMWRAVDRRRSARRHGPAEARQGRCGEAAQETAEAAGRRADRHCH